MGVTVVNGVESMAEEHWARVVVPNVLHLVSAHLSQRDVCALLCVSASCNHLLSSHTPLWKVLDLQGRTNAGERLVAALSLVWPYVNVSFPCSTAMALHYKNLSWSFWIDGDQKYKALRQLITLEMQLDIHSLPWLVSCDLLSLIFPSPELGISPTLHGKLSFDDAIWEFQPRYKNVEEINLEFVQDLADEHLSAIVCKGLQRLNLNACQKITDEGVKALATANPNLKSFSIYWNLKHNLGLGMARVTDVGIVNLVIYCKHLTCLNISGCKNVGDASLICLAKHCSSIQLLNLTRCVRLTDLGLLKLVDACGHLEELYLYAVPSFTDRSYKMFHNLHKLQLLDLCGAQNLTDAGLASIAKCKNLVSLNLTWCVGITDIGLKALAQHCSLLQLLSLHGILGVSDEGLESLAGCCGKSLTTVDVNGCVNIKRRSKEDLLRLFPNLTTFQVHS